MEQVQLLIIVENPSISARNSAWIKKSGSLFDETGVSFDGAEVCDMVGLFLLHQSTKLVGKSSIGLYRNDSLAILDASGPDLERLRKKIIKLFLSHGVEIIPSTNLVQTDFLDVTLDLKSRKYSPYRISNDQRLYIHH